VDDINNNVDLHFDEALIETETVTASTTVPSVTFLVATSYVVEIESD